jgi:NADPH:quinone reductase-like Zn-dependent oxidoreductase
MKAVVCHEYAPLEQAGVTETAKPVPKENEVLVRVLASSVNYTTLIHVTGKPFLVRAMGFGLSKPSNPIPGNDLAGRVEAVGRDVTSLSVGDEVFADLSGHGWSCYAQFVCVPAKVLVKKPESISFDQAAAVPEAGLVAFQALKDGGNLQAGQKVLIQGASGGIGSFAVQIAKALGGEVTAVCSTRNIEFVKNLGADHIVDYTKEDFLDTGTQYDLILSTAGYRSLRDYNKALAPRGIYVSTGGKMKQIFEALLLGPLYSRKRGKRFKSFLVKVNKDLSVMKDLIDEGKIIPAIDRSYQLENVKEALAHYATGKARGKVIISIPE